MCFCFPSKSYVLEPYPPKQQWRYVRQRVGTRIVSRHIEHGRNVLGKNVHSGGFMTAPLPTTVPRTKNSGEANHNDSTTSDEDNNANERKGEEKGNNAESQSKDACNGDAKSANDASTSNQDSKSEEASGKGGDNNKDGKPGNATNNSGKSSNNKKGKKGKGGGGNNKNNNNNKENQRGSSAQESSTNPGAEHSGSSNQGEKSKDNDNKNKKKVTFSEVTDEWAVSIPQEWGASATATKEGESGSQNQDTSTNNDVSLTDLFNFGDSEQPSAENTGEKSGGEDTSWLSPDAGFSWGTTDNENARDAGNASSSEWADGPGESNNISAEASSAWDQGATTTTNDAWNRQTTENPNAAQSWQAVRNEQTEVGASASDWENPGGQQDESREPKVNSNKVMEFWVHESDGSWLLKTAKEIRDNCQPGEWKQDDAGFPYFERKKEDSTSGWNDQQNDDVQDATMNDVKW